MPFSLPSLPFDLPGAVLPLLLVACAAMVVAACLEFRPSGRFRKRDLMTGNEIEFFWRLKRALPDVHVFPQVGMAALMEAVGSSVKVRRRLFWKIAAKRVDYVLCEGDLALLCVVELDDRTHNKREDAQRDAMLASAGIPIIRYESRHKPGEARLREDITRLRQKHRPVTLR